MRQKKQIRSKPAPAGPRGFWRDKLGCPGFLSILLAVVTLAVYLPTVRNGFVNYDDPDYVTSNEHVQSGLGWSNLVWAFTTGHASNWHPLTWVSHMLDCQVFGVRAGPQHLVNVGFHVLNTLLLFLVLRRMTGAIRRSALVAALFALHPFHVESVAWISERKDVLSTCFFLLTLGAYAEYARPAKPGATRARYYFGAVGLFALGLMSKPMLVTAPFVLLLLDFWPLQRLQLDFAARRDWRRVLLEKLPFLSLSFVSCVVTFLVQQKGGAVSTSVTVGARLANALVAYARYLGKTVWPQNLSILYPHPGSWPAWQVGLSALLLVAITAVVLVRRRGWLTVGWFWFVGTLVPVIGLIQVGIQSMADRYTYIPLIGLFIIIVWALAEWVGVEPGGAATTPGLLPRATLGSMIGGVGLAACALLTFIQIHYWRDSGTLFRRAAEVTRNNYLAYNNLGFYLSGQGKIEEALENYRKSVEINPNYEDALNNLGYALAGQNKNAEAVPYYEAALRIRPRHTEVHNNLGNALSGLGRNDEAIQHYRLVLEQNPRHADAHNNLGIALAMQGKLEEAIAHFRDAIRFKRAYASAHSNLGNALAAQRQFDEAIREYRISLELKPGDAQAHNNLGNALAEQGQLGEAQEQYRQALRLNTNNPEANFNLGVVLVRQGQTGEAAVRFREALRLKPDYAEAQRQLNALPGSAEAH